MGACLVLVGACTRRVPIQRSDLKADAAIEPLAGGATALEASVPPSSTATRLLDASSSAPRPMAMRTETVTLASGASFDVRLPVGLAITPASQGFKRARFMAKSPDGRLFVADLIDMSDNTRGVVYVLSGFDEASRTFAKRAAYLTGLRNPNSVAFHDDASGSWIYIALTDRLIRYRYVAGADAPAGEPETLATFPDYGLNYKYGGWHLTRTVAFGPDGTLYVSAGSSCNACEEKEPVRATVQAMTPAGKDARIFARGLRNSVGLKWIDGTLYATDMGADHLGDNAPDERMFALAEGKNYGWPHCYQDGAVARPDPQFAVDAGVECVDVPSAFALFPAHAAPLGLEHFGSDAPLMVLRDSFVVALHGSSKKSLGHGYRLVRVTQGEPPQDLITGFISHRKVHGRPVDVLAWSAGFLVSDDFAGVIYAVARSSRGGP
jgi:glucose/arabinose dehydrogenase